MNPTLLRIRQERQLVSVMNNTKWKALCEALASDHSINPSVRYKRIDSDEIYGFSPVWWDEIFAECAAIEWLDFDPIQRRFRGHLVADEEIDISQEIYGLLARLHVPYALEKSYVRVCGYLSPNGGVVFG